MARVLDRRGGLGGEQSRDVFVLVGERFAVSLLGEIEIADDAAPPDNRDAEERAHGRVPRGKPAGGGMRGQIGQPDRLSLAQHETQYTMAGWRVTDAVPELRVDPIGREALQGLSIRSTHADRRVVRSDHLRGHLHYTLEDPIDRNLRDQRTGGSVELPEAILHRWAPSGL